MCTTPAPPLTALVAASIWSGTGEVKTSPGQAASSMPEPDEAAVQRLVARAAAGDERDLAGARRAGADDDLRLGVVAQDVAVRGRQAGERVLDDLLGIVEQLRIVVGVTWPWRLLSLRAAATPPGSGCVTASLIGRSTMRGSARKS